MSQLCLPVDWPAHLALLCREVFAPDARAHDQVRFLGVNVRRLNAGGHLSNMPDLPVPVLTSAGRIDPDVFRSLNLFSEAANLTFEVARTDANLLRTVRQLCGCLKMLRAEFRGYELERRAA
jgi:hypothetical protein